MITFRLHLHINISVISLCNKISVDKLDIRMLQRFMNGNIYIKKECLCINPGNKITIILSLKKANLYKAYFLIKHSNKWLCGEIKIQSYSMCTSVM